MSIQSKYFDYLNKQSKRRRADSKKASELKKKEHMPYAKKYQISKGGKSFANQENK